MAVVLAGASAAAFLGTAERTLRLRAQTVTLGTVQQGVFHDFVPIRGLATPRDTIFLDALEGGQVQKVLVRPGDRVEENQPLIVFRNSQLELEVLDRMGRLVESITQLEARETQLESNRVGNEKALAEIDYNILRLERETARHDQLASRGLVPAQENEGLHEQLDYNRKLRPMQAQTNRNQEELRLKQLPQVHNELATLRESLQITRRKLDDLTVKAPMAGQVTKIDLKIGENRNRGERLAEIVPDTGFKIVAEIDEFYRARVAAGQTAIITSNEQNYGLTITRIYPEVRAGVFTAELEFKGASPSHLVPGAAVQGRLSLGGDEPALVLPAGAFLERTGGNWIFVIDAGAKTAHRRDIKIGRRNIEQVEVLGGLSSGERVVVSDYSNLERIDRIDLVD